jgi:ricin-type beta-trefoil lectin protein
MKTAVALLLLCIFAHPTFAGDDDLLLISKQSGKCVQVEGGGNANGAKISQGPCVTEAANRWQRVDAGSGYFFLKAMHSAKCAQVNGRSRANGAKITQWNCLDQDNVKWKERPAEPGYIYVENMESGKCMQVEGASFSSGATISQWDCLDQNNVKWRVVPAVLVKRGGDRDAIIGKWISPDIGPIKIDRREDGNYVITSASQRSPVNNVGDTIGELTYFGTNMQWDYVGRHMWGGSKTAEQYWGQQDALVVRLDGPDEMFLAFLDSQYTGGWKLRRVRE